MDADGNSVALYRNWDGTYFQLQARRHSFSGDWEAELRVDGANGDVSAPRLAVAPGGDAIAVWVQNDNIRANRFFHNDATLGWEWGTAVEIDHPAEGVAGAPQVAVDQAGNAHAVWVQQDGTHKSIYTARYDISSGSWSSPPLMLDDISLGEAKEPWIVVNDSGDAMAVWSQYTETPSEFSVYSARLE